MTFNNPSELYVWIWLPGESTPTVAGLITRGAGGSYQFNYGKSYLTNSRAISLNPFELPLQETLFSVGQRAGLEGVLRDSSPDAWGRRVILNLLATSPESEFSELTYLSHSSFDRIGALGFSTSPIEISNKKSEEATLEELLTSAEKVDEGVPLSEELAQALQHGTTIGGARPKALLDSDGKKLIAKFSSSSDTYSVIKGEFIAMKLAKLSGISAADVSLTKSLEKDVLLIKRFDRAGELKHHLISALTLLKLNEMAARHASYEDFAEIIRLNFSDAKKDLKELFKRLVFNILTGNTDDHARNHAAIYDGKNMRLSPAYDIGPQNRTGNIAGQAMLISGSNNSSLLSLCLKTCHQYLIAEKEAVEIIAELTETIVKNWVSICELSEISEIDKKLFEKRQFLNPFIYEGQSKLIRPSF